MFVYMSKKIAIPKQSVVTCLAWNRAAGYIAVGGEDGMLKVLKLESSGSGNLSMNLSLEGHTGNLQVAVWNEIHQKLTTSDEHGVIIVWMLYKGSWYEEMINNRNKSTVSGMAWSSDGQRICIAYEDGAVIVGSVDGSRVWGKDIKGGALSAVQWSPDNAMLLFAFSGCELHLYDAGGNFLSPVPVKCGSPVSELVSLQWYPGIKHSNTPVLAACYRSGVFQLMRNHNDEASVALTSVVKHATEVKVMPPKLTMLVKDSGLQIVGAQWNQDGSYLAVAGVTKDNGNVVHFYNAFGELARTLSVAAGSLRAISWSARSLRLAVAVDSFIYFAAVKTDKPRAYFDDSLAYKSSQDSVTFWDLSTHENVVVGVPGVVALAGSDEYCVIATAHSVIVSNKLGIQCDAKQLDFDVHFVAMNNKCTVIASSKHCFLVWKFASRQGCNEVLYDRTCKPIMEPPNMEDGDRASISAIACSDVHLLIATCDFKVALFSLLSQTRITHILLPARAELVELNCNSSKFYAIDSSGTLYVRSTGGDDETGAGSAWGARAAWCARWASDNPRHLAVCDKARLYVLKDGQPEEPLTANGYLCEFQDLEILSVRLDDITDKHSTEFIVRTEVKSLRDTRQLIEKVGLKEAEAFVKDNPHPKLWQLLAMGALKRVETEGALSVALGAFVRRGDMLGLRLARRVSALHSPRLQKAEVLSYFGDSDAAEKIYLEEDRRDLAIAMRERRGDWFRLAELLKTSPNANVTRLYDRIAEYYSDRQNWASAAEYFKLSNNINGLKRCYYALDDVEALQCLMQSSSTMKSSVTIPQRTVQSPVSSEVSPVTVARLREEGELQQAADMTKQLANMEASDNGSPLKIKKLYILAANLYAQNSVDNVKCAETVECFTLAAAQHWLHMTVSRATNRKGRNEAAMRAAARLVTVTASLHRSQLVQAWCAVALISAEARVFGVCSKAFQQLDALEIDNKTVFENLAIDLFSRHPPLDPKTIRGECPNCKTGLTDWATSCSRCDTEFPGCAVSGRPLFERHTVWRCRACRQCVARQDAVLRQACPVCHASITT